MNEPNQEMSNQEMPDLVFWKLLPFISQKDMPNVEKAVRASPNLCHQFSKYTKADSKKIFQKTPLICPFCLIHGKMYNPWHKIIMAIYTHHQKTWAAADCCVDLFDSQNRTIVEFQSLTKLKEKLISRNATRELQGKPENRYRRWTQIWVEDYSIERKANRLLLSIKDLKLFYYANELVAHIEAAHHPTGAIWKSQESLVQRFAHGRIRAYEIDELIRPVFKLML